MKLSKKDQELITLATDIAKSNSDVYSDISLHVGCVVLAKSGNIYKGFNLKTSHSVCAEQVALGQAFACGEREFDTLVAVRLDENGEPRVVSPCGLCRYVFDKFNLDMKIIVQDSTNGKLVKVNVSDLLPFPYVREEKTRKKTKK